MCNFSVAQNTQFSVGVSFKCSKASFTLIAIGDNFAYAAIEKFTCFYVIFICDSLIFSPETGKGLWL